MSDLIIADTSCLIVLQNIGRLPLLHGLFDSITITPEVQEEFGDSLPEWMNVMAVSDKTRQQILEIDLDRGEASALALALEHSGSTLLVDERKARRIALDLKLQITGTLGVLIRCKQEGRISSLSDEIDRLRQVNFRMSEQLIEQILNVYEPRERN